jgi:hypothetical protein
MPDINALLDQLVNLLPGDDVVTAYRLQGDVKQAIAELLQSERDRLYGMGHREGRELGRNEGWAERNSEAEAERFGLEAQIHMLRTSLEARGGPDHRIRMVMPKSEAGRKPH